MCSALVQVQPWGPHAYVPTRMDLETDFKTECCCCECTCLSCAAVGHTVWSDLTVRNGCAGNPSPLSHRNTQPEILVSLPMLPACCTIVRALCNGVLSASIIVTTLQKFCTKTKTTGGCTRIVTWASGPRAHSIHSSPPVYGTRQYCTLHLHRPAGRALLLDRGHTAGLQHGRTPAMMMWFSMSSHGADLTSRTTSNRETCMLTAASAWPTLVLATRQCQVQTTGPAATGPYTPPAFWSLEASSRILSGSLQAYRLQGQSLLLGHEGP